MHGEKFDLIGRTAHTELFVVNEFGHGRLVTTHATRLLSRSQLDDAETSVQSIKEQQTLGVTGCDWLRKLTAADHVNKTMAQTGDYDVKGINGYVLYCRVSIKPLNAPYTSPPGRPVHSDTKYISLGSIQPRCNYSAKAKAPKSQIRSLTIIYEL